MKRSRRRRSALSGLPTWIGVLFLAVMVGVVATAEAGQRGILDGLLVAGLSALVVAAILIARWPREAGRFFRRLVTRPAKPPVRPPAPVAMSREPIPAGVRFAVMKRDGFRCSYCGRGESDGVKLHIDHLVPVARGGRSVLDNLVVACQDCNLGKSASDLIGAD